MYMCTEVRVICVVRDKERKRIWIFHMCWKYITKYASERECVKMCIEVCFNTLWEKERKNMNTTYVCIILKCGEMSEQVRENACVHARLYISVCVCMWLRVPMCVRERETCRVSISRKHWTNIDISSLPFLSRDEKRVVLFIYQLLSSISEWKRGRARSCVNPCPFFSLPSLLPLFIFSPFHVCATVA